MFTNVPPGCTLCVQVVDVTVNKQFKPFKPFGLFEGHQDKHLELYVEGKLSASQQRILMTKLVDQAWNGMEESIIRSFEKYGFQ